MLYCKIKSVNYRSRYYRIYPALIWRHLSPCFVPGTCPPQCLTTITLDIHNMLALTTSRARTHPRVLLHNKRCLQSTTRSNTAEGVVTQQAQTAAHCRQAGHTNSCTIGGWSYRVCAHITLYSWVA